MVTAAVVAVAVVLVLGLGAWFRLRIPPAAPPAPPAPDLAGADPEVKEVIEAARDKVHKQPTSARAWGLLGMVLRAHDFGAEANVCFEQAERLDPADPRWPYLRGLTLVMTDPAAGIPCLERACARPGADEIAPRLRLAEVLLEQGRLDEAQVHLDDVLRREPDNCRARLGLGRLALLRGQWQTALDQTAQCVDDVHAPRLAHALRAEALRHLGQPERARDEQRRADAAPEDQLWPDPFVEETMRLQVGLRAHLRQAAALFKEGRRMEAVQVLDEAARRHPESTAAWLQLGDSWRQMGEMGPAEQAFRMAVQADPESAEAWFDLGCVQARDRPRQAADSFRRAIRLKPDHALAHYNLGHRLKELGDPAGAADEFRAALRCRPDYAPAREALAALEKKTAKERPDSKPVTPPSGQPRPARPR
jgi:cytochrome c-type biogenesis protein CcmH/NrfG